MAKFIGTIDEFIALFGGTLLTKAVTHYTNLYKKMVKTCSEPGCEKRKKLQSAHDYKNNSDRIVYARTLLQLYSTNAEGQRVVDLADFMKKFFYLHLPLHNSIKIMCKDHHAKYDKNKLEFSLSVDDVKAKLDAAPLGVEFNEKFLPIIKCKEVGSYSIEYVPDKATFIEQVQNSLKFFYHIYISDGLGTIVTKEWKTKSGNLTEAKIDGNIRSNYFVKEFSGNIEKIVVSIDK